MTQKIKKTLSSDDYKDWEDKLEVAINIHKKDVVIPLKRYRDFYNGKQWDKDSGELFNDEVVDNMVFSVISTIKPSIDITNPRIFVSPRKSSFLVEGERVEGSVGASRVQVLSEFLYSELRVEREVDKCRTDSLLGHRGIVFVGFDVKTSIIEDDSVDDEGGDPFLEMIESESIFVDRISEMDLIVDPRSNEHDFTDADWIAIRWVESLQDLKDNKDLSNTNDLVANGVIDSIDKSSSDVVFTRFKREAGGDNIAQKASIWDAVEGWNVWDKKNQKFIKIVLDHDKPLQFKTWPIRYDSFPIETLHYNYNPDQSLPLSDTKTYIVKQEFLNKFESKLLDSVKRMSDIKYAYNSKKLPHRNIVDRWAKGPSGATIPTKGPPADAITTIDSKAVSSDLYRTIQLIKQDIFTQLGIAQFEQGGADKLETADEGKRIGQAVAQRRENRSEAVRDFISRIMRKLHSVAQQVLPDGEEIPLSDGQFAGLEQNAPSTLASRDKEDGSKELLPFMKLDRKLIGGKYSFKIEVGSTAPKNEHTEREVAKNLFELAQNNPLINKVEATRIILEKSGFAEFTDRLLRDPQEVAKESQEANQAAREAALDEPRLKTSTDLEKTKMKSQVALMTAKIKSGDSERSELLGQIEGDKNRRVDIMKALIAKRDQKKEAS